MGSGMRQGAELPALPYGGWVDTKETLHLFLQIIGKVRLKAHPKLNHWWHVTLYPWPRGLTTGAIPYHGRSFEIRFDMVDHRVEIAGNDGALEHFDVPGMSVADFHGALFAALGRLGIQVGILAVPYMNKSTVPFAEDRGHASYDPDAVDRFHRIVVWIAGVFETYRGRFAGKQTPVHLFWHSFDMAVTRFSGREAPLQGGTAADREAYSHEVASIGFWPGDDAFPEPAFYAYAYPEPDGLDSCALLPAEATWIKRDGGTLGVFRYEQLRGMGDPETALLSFLESAYQAAAARGRWNRGALAHAFADE